ncbi:MAG: D-alanine--D-alanine ligase [Lachnospiraceae bacterium]|nr:D-alanine--D-alanine ligase [Lachnospiraceae bacterium]
MRKKTIAVLFGGQSSEHEVSCMSAPNVIDHIKKDIYEILIIGITEEGRWLKVDSAEDIRSGAWKESRVGAILSPDAVQKGVLLLKDGKAEAVPVDVVFPVLHGLWGEDGTVQGIFELARIPYVGCGVLASAVSMDKVYTKVIADTLGICQASYVLVTRSELEAPEAVVRKVEEKLSYPVFVKPSCAGSSRGVSQAADREELKKALKEAARHDTKILVEERIVGREIECAVLGADTVEASGVGEILSAASFYDFESKYYNAESKTVLDPELPGDAAEAVRDAAVRIFKGVDGFGLARVDFFVKADGTVVFNEINTLPGFTAISMYPSLWENRGLSKEELVERLIQTAFKRKDAYSAYQVG